jgi:hypothetical protein
MFQSSPVGITVILLSIFPLIFLIYTVTHLEQLDIDIKHPRVIVEFLIFTGLLVVGLAILFGSSTA